MYIFLVLFQIVAQADQLVTWQVGNWSNAFESIDVKYSLIDLTVWYLYHSLSFLLLIFIGLFFARKYGGFSFLLLLGYLLPTILFGRYGEWSIELPFFLIGSVILIYRFVLALVAPVWLTRAASLSKRQRAAAVPVAIAISSHILLNILAYLTMIYQTGYAISLLEIALMTCNQFITAAGLGLAVALYLPKEQEIFSPPVLAAPAD